MTGRDDDAPVAPAPGQVVRFAFTDPVFGGQPVPQVGVVVAVDGEHVQIAPVQPFAVTVALADVES